VAGSLIAWSFVMVAAERLSSKSRPLTRITLIDAVVMGIIQCLALIPGVSRSGATISAGLFRGLDRVAATRMAFLLGIPALVGAAVFELPHALSGDVGLVPVLVGTVVSFVVAYASVAWLLRFVAKHTTEIFAFYRILVGIVIVILLMTSTITAT
jgi:undecaprenyl-diphosphatase